MGERRIQIELAAVLGLFAVSVEIGRKKRRSLRRVFHHVVGKHLDHAGAKEIRIDIAFLACRSTSRFTVLSMSR